MLNDTNPVEASTASPQTPQPRLHGRRARRAVNLDALSIEKRAAEFAGLPEGVKHHDQLLETLKAAAPAIGIPKGVVELVTHLHGRTQLRDWQTGSRPLAWPSNQDLMHSMGRRPTAISDAIAGAVQLGLVVMKDSPSGKRYGSRDEAGSIIQARTFGFDLTPLALRHEELRGIAQKHRAEHTARMEARRQVTREREGLNQIIDTAAELGVWSTYWEQTAKRAEDTRSLLTPTLPLAETAHIAHCLANWRLEAREMLEQAVQNRTVAAAPEDGTEAESESQLSENRELKNTTDSTLLIDKSKVFVSAQQGECSGPTSAQPPAPQSVERAGEQPSAEAAMLLEAKGITPARIADNCPVLGAVVGPDPSWRDLGEACRTAAARYEISQRTWLKAQALVGSNTVVLIFAMMASHPDSHFTKSRGAWFAATVQKAAAGNIGLANLIASFHGMRERAGNGIAPLAAPDRKPKAYDRRAVGTIAAGLLARLGRPMH